MLQQKLSAVFERVGMRCFLQEHLTVYALLSHVLIQKWLKKMSAQSKPWDQTTTKHVILFECVVLADSV